MKTIRNTKIFYDGIVPPIVEFLKKYWNIKAKPKRYKEYCETYEDHDQIDKKLLDQMYADFKAPLDNESSTTFDIVKTLERI